TELGRTVSLRCFFLEKKKAAYVKLRQFADATADATIETRNAAFEDSIVEILDFINKGGPKSFTFLFIDPTGWTGFAMERIAPLLRTTPGEVLINFMTSHIRRFIESPDEATQASFDELFGRHVPRTRFDGLSGFDLDDALVAEYSESVASVGGFKYVRPAIVLHPGINKTHFHLIYATRNAKGVEVFKYAEKEAMSVMDTARANTQQRKRQRKKGQGELFGSETLYDSKQYESLRQRYLGRSKSRVINLLQRKEKVSYDDAWDAALQEPLVWESNLKDWIKQWEATGEIQLDGLKPRERTPKREHGHSLAWQQGTGPSP
ncbi:MAG: three-Cys-motif partner protein TcmP, partial [Phycisphaerales bacterium]|nr:three-Cys-motif partner protein TcmP [Phycisphaerales bacterium]